MRKNRTMRAAALLLALTLITSCFVGGTFAKYTTSADVEDEARVAYWGFTQTDDITFNLFESNDAGVLNNGSGLLAPGSKASAAFKFAYTDYKGTTITAPEVDYTFNITVTATGSEGAEADTDVLDANTNFVWTLQKGTAEAEKYQTFADLKNAIEALDGNKTDDKYEAGTLPDGFSSANTEYTIGWEWLFETADDDTTDENEMAKQDAVDTAMGNATDLDDIKINIKITATQLT